MGEVVLWDIAETIWDWATDNRKRAIRFFGTLGALIVVRHRGAPRFSHQD